MDIDRTALKHAMQRVVAAITEEWDAATELEGVLGFELDYMRGYLENHVDDEELDDEDVAQFLEWAAEERGKLYMVVERNQGA